MKRDPNSLTSLLEQFGIKATIEYVKPAYYDYTMESDPEVEALFGDLEDDRRQETRSVLVAPEHIRVYIGHIYLAFTTDGRFIRAFAPQDGGVLPAHVPDPDVAVDQASLEDFPPAGDSCSICGNPQYLTPHGVTCTEGHGGAPGKGEV